MVTDIRVFLLGLINGGMGTREISRIAGVSASTISRIVRGKVSPDIETANKILKPFGYKIAIEKED